MEGNGEKSSWSLGIRARMLTPTIALTHNNSERTNVCEKCTNAMNGGHERKKIFPYNNNRLRLMWKNTA